MPPVTPSGVICLLRVVLRRQLRLHLSKVLLLYSQWSEVPLEQTSMRIQAARVSWCAAENTARVTQPSGKMTIQMTLVSGEAEMPLAC
jgi:hypothetical protein